MSLFYAKPTEGPGAMYHYVGMTERTPYVYCIGWLVGSDISGCVVLGMESTLPGVFGSSNHSYSEHTYHRVYACTQCTGKYEKIQCTYLVN